jgi:hypothetical protein
MQLTLAFADLPQPEDSLWEQFEEPLHEAAIDKLADLIAKATAAQIAAKESNDE